MLESVDVDFIYNFKHYIIYLPLIIFVEGLFNRDYLGKPNKYKTAGMVCGCRLDGEYLTLKLSVYEGPILPFCGLILNYFYD
jgi:hypothetical protein